jgi:cytochrome c-type biogenesis protein CcmH/NrfG
MIKDLAEKMPKDMSVGETIAWNLFNTKKYEEAAEAFKHVLRDAPERA